MAQFDEDKQQQQLSDFHLREQEDVAQILSQKYGLEYINLSSVPINNDALRVISEAESREAGIGLFNIVDKNISLALLSPNSNKTTEAIRKLEEREFRIIPFMASTHSLEKVWNHYKELSQSSASKAGALDISSEKIVELVTKVKSLADIKILIEEGLKLNKVHKVSHVIEVILASALSLGASDIHLEPEQEYTRLRYRLDGVLTDVLNFDNETYHLMLSRIKLVSGLKLNLTGSQDGRFSVTIGTDEIEIRTSILPGAYNESIVLRILNPKSISVPLESLGISPRLLELLLKQITRANGMILTTGPTGSGKTTTLYAFLKKVHESSIKIITIENPIEYHLPGIVQTQTDPKKDYTFASGLRSALRQDPDIIMVGEIRDNETAEIAVNSALTGHLVFSTLHTNNAAGTYPRLIDLGINPKILTSAINVAMAQRLVRKLCQNCKKQVAIPEKYVASIKTIAETMPHPEDIKQKEHMFEAVGCEKCNQTGYKGRIGLYEAVLTDEAIEKTVINNPSESDIAKAARPQGIPTMLEDGITKVLNGITSLAELERVIDITVEK